MSFLDFQEKARQNLMVAAWCYAQGHYDACCNRAYYAMYQAAIAVLAMKVDSTMINFQQKEVLHNIVNTLQAKFPEVQLVSVEDLGANSFWVTMREPAEEDRQDAFDDLQAELATDALVDYGFHFRFVPASSRELAYTEQQHLQVA